MKSWLITGVGSGLGRALMTAALVRGDTVAGTVRNPGQVAEIEALAPGRAFALVADMTEEAQVGAAVEAAEERLGGLDILVGAVEEASLAEVRAQFEVNVFAPIAAIKAALPYFRKRRSGHIINITSVSGIAAWAGTGIYSASKHALEGVGRTLAQEVAPLGIQVTNVEPGGMRTDYAGRSLRVTQQKIADYEGGAHNAEQILGEKAGQEGGDPAKAAAAILKVAGVPGAPVQLLLGADAVHYATQAWATTQEEFGRWAALSLSIGFDEA